MTTISNKAASAVGTLQRYYFLQTIFHKVHSILYVVLHSLSLERIILKFTFLHGQITSMPASCNNAFQATPNGHNAWHWLKVKKVSVRK